jgi:parvulin-like peptidyl-prolyl isomerase
MGGADMSAARRWTSVGLLLIAGAVLVWAAVAGAAPARKARRAAGRPADTVLVRIGDEAITRATVQKRLDELPDQVRSNFTSAEGRQRLLERLVEERVWLKAALKAGVAERPEVKRQIEQQRRDMLIRTYVNEVMSQNPAPSDSEAQAYYQEHQTEFRTPATVTVSHIQLQTESDAKRVRQLARQKQDWKKLAARWSRDSLTRNNGGSLGTVTSDGLFGSIGRQPALAESAFALGEGKIGGPYHTERGWHVIKVESIKAESTRPFEQVRGNIVSRISSRRQQEFYQSRLQEERRRLGVHADSSAIKSFVSQKKSAREMFNEAQNAGPAATRIEAYRELLRLYPSSDVSPQAQFMLGFIHSEELKDYEAAEKEFRELLRRYPKSELAASAQWMLEHMRTEDAPGFMNLESDSATAGMQSKGSEGAKDKP